MKSNTNWKKTVERIVGSIDEKDPQQCREAFERCLQYANQHLSESLDYNLFLTEAAHRLGQEVLHWDMIKSLAELPEEARLNLVYEEGMGPVLTGNKEGLLYLAQLLKLLAEAPEPGEHTHLFPDEPPFVGETNGLTIYCESTEWFDGVQEDPDEIFFDDEEEIPGSGLQSEQVFALQFLVDNPISMALRSRRIYLVQEMKKYSGNDVWTKPIRDDDSRLWVFTIRNDRGELIEVALDLDDPEIIFLSREDVEQFLV